MKTGVITFLITFSIGLLLIVLMMDSSENYDLAQQRPEAALSLIEGGQQYVDIEAKGGYFPLFTDAQASIPTTLRVSTNQTYDCSSTLSIPSLNYFESLPLKGTTEIEIPAQEPGTKIRGICAMGMYNFEINFK